MITEPSLVGLEFDGRRWMHRWSDGTMLPLIRGGEGPDPDPKDPPKPDPKPDPTNDPKDKTFSQDDVTRIATREKEEGRRSALKDLMEQLGITDVEEAKTLLANARAAEEAKKTEAEKQAAEMQKATKAAEKAAADAQRERLTARIERHLVRAGISVEDDAKLTRLTRLVDVDNDADDDKVKDAVEQLKKDMPEVFGETKPGNKPDPKPPRSSPGGPPSKNGTKSAAESAAELLASRHPKTVKTS